MGMGGIELYILGVLRNRRSSSFHFDICTKDIPDGPCRKLFEAEGANVIHLASKAFGPIYTLKMARILRRGNYAAICDFTGDFAAASMVAGAIAGCERRIAFYRSSKRAFRPDRLRLFVCSRLRYLTQKFSTCILSNSQAAINEFYGNKLKPNKYAIVRNGVDTQRFRPLGETARHKARLELGIPQDAVVVGNVAGFRHEKNLDILIRMVSMLKREFPSVHGLIVGDGELREKLENAAIKEGVADRIKLPGVREDVPEMLAAMDVFFLSSSFEGMPNALVEAEAAAVAIVAMDRPEIREVIPEKNATAVCVNISSDTAMLSTLSQFIRSPELRKKVGLDGREFVTQHFEMSKMVRVFENWLCLE